jgi:capsular polysaccharide biosynthesis protein
MSEQSAVEVSAYAGVPPVPEEPDPLRNAFGALVIGLMLGVGLAFLLEYLYLRVYVRRRRLSKSRACPLSAPYRTSRPLEQEREKADT